jgi:hypothetical protein
MPGDTTCVVVVPPVNPIPGEECMPGDKECDKLEVDFQGCNSFQELQGFDLNVPKKSSEKVCYYKKLMSAVSLHRSGKLGEVLASGVIASDHCNRGTKSPLVMGDKRFSVNVAGKWNVALSGDREKSDATMLIDNFFLIELGLNNSNKIWGYGTKDAQFNTKYDGYVGHILVNGQSLTDFTYFANGGVAQVTAINMTEHIPEDSKFNFRFRALDNGCEATSSDVYMVFY